MMKNGMRSILVVSIGMLFSAWLMLQFAQVFFEYWVRYVPFFNWALGVQSVEPSNTAGFDFVPAGIFLSACIGAGLLMSVAVCSAVEVMYERFLLLASGGKGDAP